MGREDEPLPPGARRESVQGVPRPVGHGLDEARMVIEQPQLVDLRCGGPNLLPGPLDIFQVLPAAAVRAKPEVTKARAWRTPSSAICRTVSGNRGCQLRLPQ